MLIDCGTCAMASTQACSDCLVTYLFDAAPVELKPVEVEALDNLMEVGLVPKLRLIRRDDEAATG